MMEWGIMLISMGIISLFGERIPYIGQLPGDFTIQGEHFKIRLPLTSCFLLSIILSTIFWLLR